MSTYLELCQAVARESGTFSGTQPSSVANQTGRLAKVVSWTAEAWRQIQVLHDAWRWMRKDFTGSVTAGGTGRFTGASFSITDFAEWILERKDGEWNISLYLTASGVSDEGPLRVIDWPVWRRRYLIGTQVQDRPTEVAVSPSNELCFGNIADAAYTVRGEYRKTAQILAANADTPDCPARFHPIIVWKALKLLHEHDEAPVLNIISVNNRYLADLDALERDQLPPIRIGSKPLA
jgi:hypothetical protein